MTDLTLLLVGSGVFFVFLAGCYVAARENLSDNLSGDAELVLRQRKGFEEASMAVKSTATDRGFR